MLCIPDATADVQARFTAGAYLRLPGLLPSATLNALTSELQRLERAATRRDFAMECMNNSPRHMTTLGGHLLAEQSPTIRDLYADQTLLAFVTRVVGLPAVTVKDPVERHVLNILHDQGDTHGAHIDDYPIALVLFLQAPQDANDGGLLEYTPHTPHLDALDSPAALKAHHQPGDGYLLRSDTTAHRVTPLNRPGLRRTVLNFAYTTPQRQHATTPSAPLLYN